jgi:hypothetical protein
MTTTRQTKEATLTFSTVKLDILSRALATAEISLRSQAHKVKCAFDLHTEHRAAAPKTGMAGMEKIHEHQEKEALRRLSNSLHDRADSFHALLEEIQTELCADAWMLDANGDLL